MTVAWPPSRYLDKARSTNTFTLQMANGYRQYRRRLEFTLVPALGLVIEPVFYNMPRSPRAPGEARS